MVHVYDLGHGITCSLARDMSGKDRRALILAIELPESFQAPPREAAGAPPARAFAPIRAGSLGVTGLNRSRGRLLRR